MTSLYFKAGYGQISCAGSYGRERDSGGPYMSGNAMQNQLLEMRSTIQAQQASLHYFEAKVHLSM